MERLVNASGFTKVPDSEAEAARKEAVPELATTQAAEPMKVRFAEFIKSNIKSLAGSLFFIGVVLIIAGACMQLTQSDSNIPAMLLGGGGAVVVVDFILLAVYYFCLMKKT